jgi:hypothetical protein
MPVDYKKYPPLWFDVIRPDILKRAMHKCEHCASRNYSTYHYERGFRHFHLDEKDRQWFSDKGHKCKKVVLTISHTDHDIQNNDYSNLRALCQKCHLAHDKERHLQTRLKNGHKPKNSRTIRMAQGNHPSKNAR